MPPLSLVIDALTHAVLPAALAATAAFAVGAKTLPARWAVAAGALALAAGFLAGNFFRGAIEYRLDPERPLSLAELGRAAGATVMPPAAEAENEEEPPPPPSSYYWIPWIGGLALIAGIAARGLPPAAAWPIRLAAVAVATALGVPPALRGELPWLAPAFAAVALAEWALLENLARKHTSERSPGGVAAAGGVALLAGSAVLIHAHSGRLADVGTILGVSLAAIAVASRALRADGSGTAAGIAVALPTLMLSGYYETFSEVPAAAFALTGAGPLSLAPLLLPRVRRLGARKWWPTAAVLLVAPHAVALALTMRAESLSFE